MGKKKLTKEERKRNEAEKAEALRIEMEKERQKQLEEERQQKMIQLTEAKERRKREKEENKMRRVQLAESCKYFQEIQDQINKIHLEKRKMEEWKRYMRCNGLPNAYDSGDLRKYIHMWQLENEQYNAREQNWFLQTNERSVLTQNRMIANTTRVNLQQQQANLGDLFAKRTEEVLGILDEIMEAIATPYALSETLVEELNRLKFEFREKLTQCIDEFSFKILSNIERDMTLEGLLIATHVYACSVFKSHLWTKRDIPQPLLNEKERQKEAKSYITIDFSTLRLNLCLPPSVKCKNGAIRAMCLNFDHFSDYCPSYRIPVEIVYNFDVSQAARKEWKKRKELEKMARIDEQTMEIDSSAIAGVVPFDNFELNDMPIVDVDKLYMDYIDDIMRKERERKGPTALNLKEFEINLRQFRIIGGVYCVEYFEQPEQNTKLSPNSYLRTIDGLNTLKRKQFFQYYRAPPPIPAGVRRLPEEVEAEMKTVVRGLSKLSYITITLPDDIIWFEPPTVCRWETVEETNVSEKIENKIAPIVAQPSIKMRCQKPHKTEVVIKDFNMLQIPVEMDMNFLITEFIIPRLPDGYTVKLSDVFARRRSSTIAQLEINEKQKLENILMHSIKNVLIKTDSPRPLYPKVAVKSDLEIKEKEVKDNNGQSQNEYMFSELMRDLDDLCDKQFPYIPKQVDEISELLTISVPDVPDVTEIDSEQNFGDLDVSFLKSGGSAGERFSWNISKKKDDDIKEKQIEEDSADDSIDIGNEVVDEPKAIECQNIVGRWSTRDVHDSKFNEEKLAIQFRAGRLGHFGLAINWYCNLPFQTWELKPDTKASGTILFSLTAAVASIEITITETGTILNSFQGGVSAVIQDIIGKNISFSQLKNLLLKYGINLFPDIDAFCYCESTCEKDFIMESHLYDCMAHLGLSHNFMWSRWNSQLSSRSAVLLVREILEKRKAPNYSTLFVTPLKACLVECTEVSISFNPAPLPGMNFYADLYHLSKEISQQISIEKQVTMSPLLRDNILQVLKSTRPLSFC